MSQDTLVCVNTTASWSYQKTKNGKWVGECAVLHSMIQSETLEELIEDIHEAMMVLFADLEESGELDQLAAAQGWTVKRIPLGGAETESDGSFDVSRPVVYRSSHAVT